MALHRTSYESIPITEAERSPAHAQPSNATRTVALVVGGACAIALVVVYCTTPHASWREVTTWLQEHNTVGGGIFALVYAFCIIVCCPSTIFDLFAGYTFGVRWGTAVAVTGKVLGSVTAFAVGRYLIQDHVRAKLDAGRPMFRAWARLIERHEVQFVVLIQLAYLPIALKNYGLSILDVSFAAFALSTLVIGGIESYLSVVLGHSTTKISAILVADPVAHTPESHAAQQALVIVAAASTLGLVLFLGYRIRAYFEAVSADEDDKLITV
ncbi:ATP-binding Cassette (ABC) superfamily [Achlya hypogyna]|uniref:ATP-binding Cassette (ABC) superfamily n=1 Tax=Achlya hypogyna TaxID=1202772 RepID=A0A1V9ZIP9_ACHHY|nr:ATP-binding Cassette (ABC) superfamily [Achlya hypogyna]